MKIPKCWICGQKLHVHAVRGYLPEETVVYNFSTARTDYVRIKIIYECSNKDCQGINDFFDLPPARIDFPYPVYEKVMKEHLTMTNLDAFHKAVEEVLNSIDEKLLSDVKVIDPVKEEKQVRRV